MLGREVALLYDGYGTRADQRVNLDARGLAPGIYFLRMTAGETVQTQKVVVAR